MSNKKRARKKHCNMALKGLTAFAVLASGFTTAEMMKTAYAVETPSAANILKYLSHEQRAALQTLQASQQTGLQLNPSVNLESDKAEHIIVQFKEAPSQTAVAASLESGKKLSLAEAKAKVETSHRNFQKGINELIGKATKSLQSDYKINHSFKHSFNGVAMTVPASEIKKLQDLDEVQAIWSDMTIALEQPIIKEEKSTVTNMSGDTSQIHAEGYTGKGIKVAVIDTGIDYHHPDLKDAYQGGYDFVDDDADPMETTYDDWRKSGRPESTNGQTYYTSHGTHVAGIVAGQGKNTSDVAITGVAPEADLYAYRVLGPYGSGSASDIIAAIEKAVTDDMDIMNLSLGASINDPLYPTSIAVNNAVLAGVTAVVAAGNSGSGMKTLSSPGTSTLALTVGANDISLTVPTFTGGINGNQGAFDVDLCLLGRNLTDDITKMEGTTLSVVDVGLGQATNYTGKNVTGKAVLIARGVTSFADKIKLAKSKGAAAVLLYNDNVSEGHIPYYIGETMQYIPAFSLTNQNGLAIKERVETGEVDIAFKGLGSYTIEGGNLADFSSRGPSRMQYEIKPEVTAPGVQILSTVPSYMNGAAQNGNYHYAYQRFSGTSMASPYVAGVAALLLQKNPNLTPDEIRGILMNTADPLRKDYSVFEAGSGQVDANEALHSEMEILTENPSKTVIEENLTEIKVKSGALNFGAALYGTESFTKKRSVTLENHDKHPKTFEVKVEFQAGLRGSMEARENGVTLQADKQIITIPGGQQRVSDVVMTVPAKAKPGAYEGFVTYQNKIDRNEVYQLPFALVVTEEGFQEMAMNPRVMPSNYDIFYPLLNPYPGVDFTLKSPMETIDFILVDGKTNEELGFLGQIQTANLVEDRKYSVGNVFTGSYFPFTGDPNQPISSTKIRAPHGQSHFKVKMIGTNKEGRTFSLSDDMIVDATGPDFITDLQEGVIEYKPGTMSYSLKGTLIDKNFADFKNQGVSINQSGNFIMEKNNSSVFTNGFFTNANGEFSYNIPISLSAKSTNVEMYGYNAAGIGKHAKYFTFIPEGAPYVYGAFENSRVKMGETVKVTLVANNMKDVKKVTNSFTFNKSHLEVVDVKAHPSILDWQPTLTSETVLSGIRDMKLNMNVELTSGTMSGDVPVAEVTLKVKDDAYNLFASFTNTTATYVNTTHETLSAVSVFHPLRVVPTYSKISGNVTAPEAFKRETGGGWLRGVDASQIGATFTVKDQAGNEYPVNIDKYATIRGERLPITMEKMGLTADIPGHFTMYTPFHVGYINDEGIVSPQWNPEVYVGEAAAGDVNKDHVIDILDAIAVEAAWGTNKRAADINFDGTVNAADMKYIQNNYLKKNPTVQGVQEPKEGFEGRTLDDVLTKLGIK
ncbi:S8 family serine peptidase [Ectobacillus sp. JY-23]|uniref:S8 family serine peptidase n=1 Tax=Ectobacillus sp. JY-23 TaxID=2933872 RepID=UPI001FF34D62|nr:S8 family serine peptidase [Ectobacillus sp. JY-23]UOY93125.1 S8 family serine peptidase [Ectobacillus sp. JY-23]